MKSYNSSVSAMSEEQKKEKLKDYSAAFGFGIASALLMSFLGFLGRSFGLFQLNYELQLGSLFTQSTGIGTWLLGFALQVVNGGVFALLRARWRLPHHRGPASVP